MGNEIANWFTDFVDRIFAKHITIIIYFIDELNEKVHVGNDQERRNQIEIPTPKTETGNQIDNYVLILREHKVR